MNWKLCTSAFKLVRPRSKPETVQAFVEILTDMSGWVVRGSSESLRQTDWLLLSFILNFSAHYYASVSSVTVGRSYNNEVSQLDHRRLYFIYAGCGLFQRWGGTKGEQGSVVLRREE